MSTPRDFLSPGSKDSLSQHHLSCCSLGPLSTPDLQEVMLLWLSPPLGRGLVSLLCTLLFFHLTLNVGESRACLWAFASLFSAFSLHGFQCHLPTDGPKCLPGSLDLCIQPLILCLHGDIPQACEIPRAQNTPLILHPPPHLRLFPFPSQ